MSAAATTHINVAFCGGMIIAACYGPSDAHIIRLDKIIDGTVAALGSTKPNNATGA